MNEETELSQKYNTILPFLSERQRRIYLSVEAKHFGYGGITKVSKLSGVSRVLITKGKKELEENKSVPFEKSRKEGGGRKKKTDKYPGIKEELKKIIEPHTRGEPESALLWTSKSLRKISAELKEQGFTVSYRVVGEILKSEGFSLQAYKKTDEGKSHPDRNEQFLHIHQKVKNFQVDGDPVISIDAKKKELIGNFKNNGKEWRPKGQPEETKVYDFPSDAEGKVTPYGVYDFTNNKGWVSVGIDKDTSEFAVQSIRNWWYKMGSVLFEQPSRLLITADGGGSNGSRVRLWKKEIQDLANELNMDITVCHFPPGTSKWNKIEHKLFSYISLNWRGKPLTSYEVVVKLIGSTTTAGGLKVLSELDTNAYKKGIKVSDKDFEKLNIEKDDFHGEWNYTIKPQA
ncbi:MAG: ISAzo13 family transposase [Bacteroidetes bacterium]|nr:ISAzo13 family transposase [Bacteroidota bacterium]